MRQFKLHGLATFVCVVAMVGLFTVLCAADGPSGALPAGDIATGAQLGQRTDGDVVEVTVTGTVFFNGIGDPPLSDVQAEDAASLTFLVDSNNFMDGVGNTRGYVIDQSSFVLTLGSVEMGLADPFPAGETPYFTLADGIPVADRFWVSTSVNSPGGVPLAQDPIEANVDLGYTGDTLSSLDILDALGTYDFDGLTSFGFNLWAIFPDNVVLGIDFEQMTIAGAGGECGTGGPCVKGLECFTGCGELIQGVECVLFLADAGGLFLLDNLGGFNVGDQVEVTGCLDPGCFTICLEGDGCIFQNTIADCVIDDCSSFTCGQNNNKVLLCHVPPGNPGNAHTICISPSALPAHLAQHPGDHCGPCAAVQDAGDLGELPSVQVDVLSNLPGVFVNIGPPDMFDDGGGVVALERFYQPGSVVVLNAPKVFNGRAFLGWNVEGIGFDGWYTGASLALPIIDGYTIEAVYCEPGFRSAPSSPRR